jgi:transcriptional regulator with XRE-family HTH domain
MRGTLKQWRMFNGMTQEQLAKATKRSVLTVINWEKGVSEPNASDIATIEKVLGVNWSNDVIWVRKGLPKK